MLQQKCEILDVHRMALQIVFGIIKQKYGNALDCFPKIVIPDLPVGQRGIENILGDALEDYFMGFALYGRELLVGRIVVEKRKC